jgi:glycosyltransferase involved in cell wall biosynthesis
MRTNAKALRVVLVCEAAGGGVGKHVLDIAERLPPLGFEVLVVHAAHRADPDFADRLAHHAAHGYHVAPVDVHRAPGPHDVVGVLQLRRAVREFGGADILHGHSAKGGALARLARWRCARRVFYTPHAFYAQAPALSGAARRFYGVAERALSLATDQVIATSRDELGLARALGIPERKVTVVENGIEIRSDTDLQHDRATARAALGVAATDRLVGFVGRLVPQKAPTLAVETFRLIRRAHRDTRFVLMGDGPEAPAVSAVLAKDGLASDVRWVRGAVARDLLPAVDVVLVTSHYEGFSYVMLEALDSGCAIVTTLVGGARDCVVDEGNGEIVTLRTPDALASAVGHWADSPVRLCAAHVVSRERVQHFGLERMVDRLVTLYRNAIDDGA